MSYMTDRCGAWQVGDDSQQGDVEFRLFFPAGSDPQISSIRVAGSFQSALGLTNWDFPLGLPLVRDDTDYRGTFWTARTDQPLAKGFYEYKYLVDFDNGESRIVTDPCTRYGGLSDRNSGIVVGGSQPVDNAVRPLAGGRRPLADLIVYELMVDDFTADYRLGRAPLDAVVDKLDYLRALGINAVLFMPWTVSQDPSFDWGYDPLQYFAVEARYANDLTAPEEKLSWLKQVASACHDRGIHVVMDGVYNHASMDFPYPQFYLDQRDCPFTQSPFGGQFPGLLDLDFANSCTQEFVLDVCQYWVTVFGIDGIRFDNSTNYYITGDIRGLPELLSGLSGWLVQSGQANFSLTLEYIDISAASVTNQTAADSFWDNSLYGLTFEYLWNGVIDSRLLNALNNRSYLAAGKVPTLYLSNHDHSHVAWQAGARDNLGATGAWWALQPYVIALLTATAVPMIPNGQEFGQDYFLPEDDHGTGRRVVGRPLRWKCLGDEVGRTLHALHSYLADLRGTYAGLRSPDMYPAHWDEWQTRFSPVGVGVDISRQLVIYQRWTELGNGDTENFVILLNFSDSDQTTAVPFPVDGRWSDLLAGFDGGPDWSAVVSNNTAQVPVNSHWGRILYFLNPAP